MSCTCWSVSLGKRVTYDAHKFPRHGESKMTGGEGSVEIFRCNNCSLATKLVWIVTRDGNTWTSETVVEPKEPTQ